MFAKLPRTSLHMPLSFGWQLYPCHHHWVDSPTRPTIFWWAIFPLLSSLGRQSYPWEIDLYVWNIERKEKKSMIKHSIKKKKSMTWVSGYNSFVSIQFFWQLLSSLWLISLGIKIIECRIYCVKTRFVVIVVTFESHIFTMCNTRQWQYI